MEVVSSIYFGGCRVRFSTWASALCLCCVFDCRGYPHGPSWRASMESPSILFIYGTTLVPPLFLIRRFGRGFFSHWCRPGLFPPLHDNPLINTWTYNWARVPPGRRSLHAFTCKLFPRHGSLIMQFSNYLILNSRSRLHRKSVRLFPFRPSVGYLPSCFMCLSLSNFSAR